MPAKVTTARDRSKGKAKTPVTTTKGRANRQSVSKATVTQGGAKGTGTARVTTGKGSAPRALPLGKSGGALVKSTGSAATDARIYQSSVGEVTKRPKPLQQSSTKALPPGKPGGPMVSGGAKAKTSAAKASGNFKAPSIPKTPPKDIPSPPKPSGLGSMRTGIAGAVASAATDKLLSPMAFKAGQKIGTEVRRRFGNSAQRSETDARTNNKPQQGPPTPTRKPSPPKPPSTSTRTSRSGSSSSSSSSSGSDSSSQSYGGTQPSSTRTSSSPSSPSSPSPASNAGMKNQDKNFRGNPNNPRSIASTLKELASIRPKPKAQESNATTKKSPDGRDYMGPAYGETKANNTTTPPAKRQSTLQEEIRKRRLGLM